jgi:hypothetical protein
LGVLRVGVEGRVHLIAGLRARGKAEIPGFSKNPGIWSVAEVAKPHIGLRSPIFSKKSDFWGAVR